MLAFNVINLEQHRALQQNAAKLPLPEAFLLTELSPAPKIVKPNRQIPELLSGRKLDRFRSRKTEPSPIKNEAVLAKWAPTSNRQWPANRCYRKQRIKPCLTGARTHIRETAFRINFRTSAANLSDELRFHSEASETPSQSSNLSRNYGRS
jgi:hypothetical protein